MPTERSREIVRKQAKKFSRNFLLIVLLGVSVLFVGMIRPFLVPILLAAVFTTLFHPLYRFILRHFRNRRGLSSFACCLVLFLGLITPLYILGNLVTHEAVSLFQTAEESLRNLLEKGDAGPLGRIKNSSWFQSLQLEKWNWQEALRDAAGAGGKWVAELIRKTSGGAFQAVATVFVTFFIMFYFFRDGEAMMARIKYLVPLSEKYEDALISRFVAVSRATIKGSLLVGLTQSTLGALTLWIFGVESPALWWVVMVILSMIPLVGAWAVMHPAAIIQIILGNVWQGVGIFLVTIFIISTIDNVMRPRLVGQFTGIHDLVVFFSAFGGLVMFGPLGVLVGPIIAAFFVTILEIYSMEFKSQLDASSPAGAPTIPARSGD